MKNVQLSLTAKNDTVVFRNGQKEQVKRIALNTYKDNYYPVQIETDMRPSDDYTDFGQKHYAKPSNDDIIDVLRGGVSIFSDLN